jgi:hypothetical protein
MKTVLCALMLLGLASQANANEVKIGERTVTLNVPISDTTVKLSRADYQTEVVKVLVPELADVTILNHRNTREGAPCLATYQTPFPNAVILHRPAIEKIEFKITLSKLATLDPQQKFCSVVLKERVEGYVRGYLFEHERFEQVANRDPADCR